MRAARIGDLTREEFKELMREVLQELLLEFEQETPDPDEGLEFRPEIAERLAAFLRDKPRGRPFDEVMRELGLDLND